MARMARVMAVAVAFASAACTVGPAHALFGGRQVEAGHPLQRTAVMLRTKRSSCTGFVLTHELVATAAHCVLTSADVAAQATPAEREKANSGRKPLELSEIRISYPWSTRPARLEWMEINPTADVAVLRVAGSHPDGYVLHPYDLRTARDIATAGNTMFMQAGFGNPSANSTFALRVLEAASSRVTSSSEGKAVIYRSGSNGTCAGDSGGPTLVLSKDGKLHLVGVHSAGNRSVPEQAIADSDGLCSRVSIFSPFGLWRPWLVRILEERGLNISLLGGSGSKSYY